MYVELTDMCNMQCPHCGMNAKKRGKGTFMSEEHMDTVVELFRHYGNCYLTVGGGEPMMHPLYRTFIKNLCDAANFVTSIAAWVDVNITVITNGSFIKNFNYTRNLYERSKEMGSNILALLVSTDAYHDRGLQKDEIIDWAVRTGNRHGPNRAQITPFGRAIHNQLVPSNTQWMKCWCDNIYIRANGDIHVCGCETSPIIANLSELNGTESIEEDAVIKFHNDKYCTDPEADDYMLHRTWKTEKEVAQCAS